MDVAMEGKNTALLTLLILIQFAEMKSAVLKDMDAEKLFNICYNGNTHAPSDKIRSHIHTHSASPMSYQFCLLFCS